MKLYEKVFLFVVGVLTMAFDEATKEIESATRSMQDQRKKLNEAIAK